MAEKVSRIISVSILALALIAVLMALRSPSATLVPGNAQDAKSFDENILSLEQAYQQGVAQTAHSLGLFLASNPDEKPCIITSR